MKTILKIASYIGLALTIGPSFLVLNGAMELKTHFHLMIAGMVIWFITAPFWMKNTSLDDEAKDQIQNL